MDGAGINRRRVLGAAAAGVVGLAGMAACDTDDDVPAGSSTAPPVAPSALAGLPWDRVRAEFALAPGIAHLAAFVFAPHPAIVRAAIARHRDGFDSDPLTYLHGNQERNERAVAAAASAYLGTDPAQIAFTDSTTMGLGLLYSGLRLSAGDEVLTTEHDFYATHESLRLRSVRDGITVRRVRLYDDPAQADPDAIVDALDRVVSARTRIVALTWVHSSTGVRLPVAQISARLRRSHPDVLICVDGVHGLAAVASTPQELGCDFLVSGTHKWLHGPRGTGLIWGSERGWRAFTPIIPAFGEQASTPGGYHTFEHRWALAEAFAFQSGLGPARVAERITTLASSLKDGLAGIRGLRLITPRDPALSAGIVCCDIDGLAPAEAVQRLAAKNVHASVTPYDPPYLRFGTTIVNSEADVAAALSAVHELT
jgi:selenocysteine lyase/cysteine desulfurase